MNDVDSTVTITSGAVSTPTPSPVAAVAQPAAVVEAERVPQDWELLVSEGHVRGRRLLEVGKTLFWPALACFLFGGWLVWSGLAVGVVTGYGLPRAQVDSRLGTPVSIARMLVWDPNTYAAIPGREERAGYQLAWLEGAVGSPQRGLTAEAWGQLLAAAQTDVRASGDKVAEWTAIPAAAALNPKVTRPEKALSEFKADLVRGIIAIPSTPLPATSIGSGTNALAYVAAWVEGKFSFALLTPPPNSQYGTRNPPCYVAFEAAPGCILWSYLGKEIVRLQPRGES